MQKQAAVASAAKSQFAPTLPQFARTENSRRRDDAGDQLRWRHVEARIARAARRIGHAHVSPFAHLPSSISQLLRSNAPRAQNFLLVPFLDGNVEAALHVPVNGRKRYRDVKRNLVTRSQHGLRVGANFVRHFAGASERPVAADDDEINFPTLHQMAGRVVSDDLVGNVLLRQFPCGQRRALRARTGLIAEDVEFFPGGLRGVERRGRAADIDERQPAGVAMREHLHAVTDQFRAVPSDGFAMGRAKKSY